MRGFNSKGTSQAVKNYLTGSVNPWLPTEVYILEKNLSMPTRELQEVLARNGFTKTMQSITKKRLAITAKRLLNFDKSEETVVEEKTEVGSVKGEAPDQNDASRHEPEKTASEQTKSEPPTTISFGAALLMLKGGSKIARTGWNGKGMWLIYIPSSPNLNLFNGSPYFKAGLRKVTIDAHIDMYTAQGTMQPGWLASQADMLAKDWIVVD